MNNCILMAEIVQDPELRYTPDNQTPIAEMWVQFPGLREEDPPAKLKAVGWGNLAQEIQQNYHQGEQVILEGRLHMITFDRPEGFKEKRAELTVQRIHRLGATGTLTTATAMPTAAPMPSVSSTSPTAGETTPKTKPAKAPTAVKPAPQPKVPAYSAPPAADPTDYDDIPF
ncbi:MAG: single-stranded DNA-binding protein [Synechococcales cyanobacterium C42_A2020_086]|jgi:single-stranded DNA-binding protein|nr:single-stranded DNA-binding protein [Synechococcales cyanobacterium M58_A2018_015]MBF2075372.1 single-stranded DNA-binding protein [Synechococcales cyanobacterium C42_A2020_086]